MSNSNDPFRDLTETTDEEVKDLQTHVNRCTLRFTLLQNELTVVKKMQKYLMIGVGALLALQFIKDPNAMMQIIKMFAPVGGVDGN